MESKQEVLLSKPVKHPLLNDKDHSFQLQISHNQENTPSPKQEDMKEVKAKLKVMTTKFQKAKKEVTDVKKNNTELHNEIMSLQNNIRSMVPGVACSGSSFPLFNELFNEVSEFLKCDC
jgi:uncharacterized phage infection (PIP) family protein YhgE